MTYITYTILNMLFNMIFLAILLVGCKTHKQPMPIKQIDYTTSFNTVLNKTLPNFTNKLFSIHINGDLRTKISTLSHIILHPDLNYPNIKYQTQNKNLMQICKDICNLCNWRMRINCNSIELLPNKSFTHIHHISILDNNINSAIVTSISAENKKGLNLGSMAKIETKMQHDLFDNIKQFLDFLVHAQTDHQITQHTHFQQNSQTEDEQRNFTPTPPAQEQIVHDINDLAPLADKEDHTIQSSAREKQNLHYSINKQAGLIVLHATQDMHLQLARYLHALEHKASTQVRIEAKIIQVDLFDKCSMGINWNNITPVPENIFQFNTQNKPFASFSLADQNINSLIEAMQDYGTTHIISKPELTILHNEIGLFKVVENHVYFTMKAYQVNSVKQDSTSLLRISEPNVIAIGFSMTIQPSINQNTGDIILHIRPTITSITGEVNDPSVALDSNANKVESKYPVTVSKEFDTKLKLKPGQWAVLGGYIDSFNENRGAGLPGVKSILGFLGGSKSSHKKQKEIVVLLRAHPENSNVVSLENRETEIYME